MTPTEDDTYPRVNPQTDNPVATALPLHHGFVSSFLLQIWLGYPFRWKPTAYIQSSSVPRSLKTPSILTKLFSLFSLHVAWRMVPTCALLHIAEYETKEEETGTSGGLCTPRVRDLNIDHERSTGWSFTRNQQLAITVWII